MAETIVQGEIELVRRYGGQIAEIAGLALGFVVGIAVLSGAAGLLISIY